MGGNELTQQETGLKKGETKAKATVPITLVLGLPSLDMAHCIDDARARMRQAALANQWFAALVDADDDSDAGASLKGKKFDSYPWFLLCVTPEQAIQPSFMQKSLLHAAHLIARRQRLFAIRYIQ